jgi:hypothetical protein
MANDDPAAFCIVPRQRECTTFISLRAFDCGTADFWLTAIATEWKRGDQRVTLGMPAAA